MPMLVMAAVLQREMFEYDAEDEQHRPNRAELLDLRTTTGRRRVRSHDNVQNPKWTRNKNRALFDDMNFLSKSKNHLKSFVKNKYLILKNF